MATDDKNQEIPEIEATEEENGAPLDRVQVLPLVALRRRSARWLRTRRSR